jgi:hypothetical protein
MLAKLTETLREGTLDDAEEALGRAHQFFLRECPQSPGGVLEGMNVHLWTAEAVKISRDILDKRRAAIPAAALPEVAKSISCLADMLLDQGLYTGLELCMSNLKEIEDLTRQAVEINRAACPAGHPALIASITKLAFAVSESGKYGPSEVRGAHIDEARNLFREVLDMTRATLPSGHPDLATAVSNLATQLGSDGEGDTCREEIERLFSEALDINRAAFPAGHPAIAASMTNLAIAHGDMDQIKETLKEVVAMNKAYHPVGHHDIASAINLLEAFGGSG